MKSNYLRAHVITPAVMATTLLIAGAWCTHRYAGDSQTAERATAALEKKQVWVKKELLKIDEHLTTCKERMDKTPPEMRNENKKACEQESDKSRKMLAKVVETQESLTNAARNLARDELTAILVFFVIAAGCFFLSGWNARDNSESKATSKKKVVE
jgi:Fe2+ transport system protein B